MPCKYQTCELQNWHGVFKSSDKGAFSARCKDILARSLCRWTLQGLAYVELSGRVFDPPGCVAEGMPGASADDLRQVRPAWMHQTVGNIKLMRACAWMLKSQAISRRL